ncbi:MAG: spore germination protein [Bacilli bacterium]|nr:spore germination protein [Bacilli bacterium]
MFEYIDRLKKDTNNITDIVYRKKRIRKKDIYIIFNEPLTSGDRISDHIFESLFEMRVINTKKVLENIENNIYNFKVTTTNDYDEMCYYLHNGFTIIIIENDPNILVLETKSNDKRAIAIPSSENTLRGSKDAFIEDYQTNMGLIKRRIRDNNLWVKDVVVGKYSKTKIGILYLHDKCEGELVDRVYEKLKDADVESILNSGAVKSILGDSNIEPMPTIMSTERPDRVARALIRGKICILVDNDPYVLILPVALNDFFKTTEDYFGKNINTTFTRIIRFLAFYIALFTPALYIALITYNQEMLPNEFLVNFAMQRSTVPFPAFFEAFMMMIAFELLHESDLRTSGFAGSSLSIVGALILGDAAVSAGLVSPIMIIVIALTAIASLPFNEYDLVNGLRWYRILFMIGSSSLGIIGIVLAFIFFVINMASTSSYGEPYLTPLVPTNFEKLKDSIIRMNPKR